QMGRRSGRAEVEPLAVGAAADREGPHAVLVSVAVTGVAERLQPLDPLRDRSRRPHDNIDVDFRLGAESGNRGASDMANLTAQAGELFFQRAPDVLEGGEPARIVVQHDDGSGYPCRRFLDAHPADEVTPSRSSPRPHRVRWRWRGPTNRVLRPAGWPRR